MTEPGINAPQAAGNAMMATPSYPIAQGYAAGDERTHVEESGLAYAREVGITRTVRISWTCHRTGTG